MSHTLLEGLTLMGTGMGVVFVLFILLYAIIQLLARSDEIFSRKRERQRNTEVISPEEIAVITAAASMALRQRVHIHHVHMIQDQTQESWSRQGRIRIMESHHQPGPQ